MATYQPVNHDRHTLYGAELREHLLTAHKRNPGLVRSVSDDALETSHWHCHNWGTDCINSGQ